jgi:hypothetical protein
MKTLTLDIECRPSVVHRWDLFDTKPVGLNQVETFGGVFALGAKWYGSRKVEFFSDHHTGHSALVDGARALLDEADVVVHYNGTSFDLPWLMTEIVLADLTPPSPVQEVDLYRAVRRRFRFASNKLDHVARQLGLGGKVSHSGHELWMRCLAGDDAAWAKMREYNIGDVVLTEKLYDRLLPWIKGHPSVGLYSEDGTCCPQCGEPNLTRQGYALTALAKYQRYRCEACGAWSRGKQALATVDVRAVA